MAHKIQNLTYGETIITEADNKKIYIYKLTNGVDYRKLHKAAKQLIETKPKLLWSYSLVLYNACNGNIRKIKDVLKYIKDIETTEAEYNRLREYYELSADVISDRCIECFKVNPFKIILD